MKAVPWHRRVFFFGKRPVFDTTSYVLRRKPLPRFHPIDEFLDLRSLAVRQDADTVDAAG